MCDSSVSVEPEDIVLEGSSAQRSHFSPSLNYEAVQNRKSSRILGNWISKKNRVANQSIYSEQQSTIRTDSGTTYWFSVSEGVR